MGFFRKVTRPPPPGLRYGFFPLRAVLLCNGVQSTAVFGRQTGRMNAAATASFLAGLQKGVREWEQSRRQAEKAEGKFGQLKNDWNPGMPPLPFDSLETEAMVVPLGLFWVKAS